VLVIGVGDLLFAGALFLILSYTNTISLTLTTERIPSPPFNRKSFTSSLRHTYERKAQYDWIFQFYTILKKRCQAFFLAL